MYVSVSLFPPCPLACDTFVYTSSSPIRRKVNEHNTYMVYYRIRMKEGGGAVKYNSKDTDETNLLGVKIASCARHWSRERLLSDDLWEWQKSSDNDQFDILNWCDKFNVERSKTQHEQERNNDRCIYAYFDHLWFCCTHLLTLVRPLGLCSYYPHDWFILHTSPARREEKPKRLRENNSPE